MPIDPATDTSHDPILLSLQWPGPWGYLMLAGPVIGNVIIILLMMHMRYKKEKGEVLQNEGEETNVQYCGHSIERKSWSYRPVFIATTYYDTKPKRVLLPSWATEQLDYLADLRMYNAMEA
ncbi:hypothetical protein FKW77_005919 [Venturia effusa]|uniref:Uncharacterized protein n=1 Tax=Venturia effusa TaxID=50376 RepID=A0A517L9D9_9PEZI|nr:hypothetical protein FKW77_005919 [Venturia effusa]